MIEVSRKRDMSEKEWAEVLGNVGVLTSLVQSQSIFIKPNFAAGTYASADGHVVSDLALLATLVNFVHAQNPAARILIGESDSTGYGHAYAKFEHLGLPDSLDLNPGARKRVELLDLSRDRLVLIENAEFMYYCTPERQLWLSRTLVDSCFRISLCNLKTHSVTGYTGACKNLFGCLPDSDKSLLHPFIHEVVHDVTLALQPDLSIVDAFFGMERNGPVHGNPVDSGLRVVSDNAVEADLYAMNCASLPARRAKYVVYLARHGFPGAVQLCSPVEPYRPPARFLRVMNRMGLSIQRFGQAVERFGHRVHAAANLPTLVGIVLRPILVRVFDIETLRRVNRRFNR